MRVLVIGASGMLARPVIRSFSNAGFNLRLFSRNIQPSMFDREFDIVQGDVLIPDDVDRAMEGCEAVHISLSRVDESKAVSIIVEAAKRKKLKLISFVSGSSVSQENRWFEMIDRKYRAEMEIISSGIAYLIFRPTWFFESLALMVRDGKAMILGKQPHPAHWVAADDFARMVTEAYRKGEAQNKIFPIHGPEPFLMVDLLNRYIRERHPEIKKVSSVPIGLLKTIAFLTRNKDLKMAANLFSYFGKSPELGNPSEANALLGKPEITFEKWLKLKN